MLSLYVILLCLQFAINLSATPQNLYQRDNAPSTSTINTTVIDQNGHDISSSFKKLVYYYKPDAATVNGVNGGQAGAARSLTACGVSQGLFVESHCNYEDGVPGSTRPYTYKCLNYKKGVRNKKYGVVEVSAYSGTCDENQICVNGPGREGDWSNGSAITAFCINTDAFVGPTDANFTDLSGTTLTTLLTSPDMNTPLMGGKIDIETAVSTSGNAGKHEVIKECVQCLSLTTEKLASDMKSIDLSETWSMARAVTLASISGILLTIILGI